MQICYNYHYLYKQIKPTNSRYDNLYDKGALEQK